MSKDLRDVARDLGIRHEKDEKYYCPRHDDNTPDLCIEPDKFHCWGSRSDEDEGGYKPVTLVMHIEGYTSVKDGVERLKELYPEEYGEEDVEDIDRRKEAVDVLERATELGHKALMEDRGKIKERIKEKRDFPEELIQKLRIGFFTPEVVKELEEQFPAQALVDSGIFNKDDKTGDLYTHLKSRVIFPYQGYEKTRYLIGRKIEEDHGEKYKKVRNTDYNRHILLSYEPDRGRNTLIVTEGVTDAISVYHAGYNVVSPVTTKFKKTDREKIIRKARNYDKIYLCMDADKGGRKGAEDTAQHLVKEGINPYMVELPEGKDMDDWTTEHGYEIDELLDKGGTYLDIKLDKIQELKENEERAESSKETKQFLRLIKDWDPVEQDPWLDDLPGSKKMLREQIREVGEEKKGSGDENSSENSHIVSKLDTEEILAEEISTDRGPRLAYENGGELKVKESIELDGVTYEPRVDQAVKKGTVLLPTDVKEYGSTKELLEEIKDLIHKYVDVSEKYEKMAGWYVMTTWVYDELSTLSYLRALGDTGTGKSRFLDVVGNLCYKPIFISGAVTPAPIYRLIEQWEGTLLIDEGDMKKSDAMNEVVTILNCGFERNKPVIRCDSDDYDAIQFYNTFGPKVIATRQEFNDKALESRCLTEKMSQTTRTDIPDQLPKSFYGRAQELRNKLLKWRFDKKPKMNVEETRNVDLGKVEPRLKQATRGFLAVFNDDPEVKEHLLEFLRSHQRELIEQRSETWEGMIVNTIYEKYKENGEKAIKTLSPGEIADYIDESFGEKKITAGHVGKKLRSLKLETERKRIDVEGESEKKQRRVLVWDMDQLETLFERYVPEYLDFVTAVTDVTGVGGSSRSYDESKERKCDGNTTLDHHRPSQPSQPSQQDPDENQSSLDIEEVKHNKDESEREEGSTNRTDDLIENQIRDSLRGSDGKLIDEIHEDVCEVIDNYNFDELKKDLELMISNGKIVVEETKRAKFYSLNSM